MGLVINGRFATRPVTGVERAARLITERLVSNYRLESPPNNGRALGKLWELSLLGLVARDDVLWSPCNFGPLIHPRHVLTIHDISPFDLPAGFTGHYRAMARTLTRALVQQASIVVTSSRFTAERLKEVLHMPSERVRVVPLAAPPPSSEGHLLSHRAQTFITVGSLDPRKGLRDLIQAFTLAGLAEQGWELRIVGGTNASVFAESGVFGQRTGVTWLGRLSDHDLAREYRQAHAFITNSRYEGFGLTPLEARAAGTRALVSDIPPHRESLAGEPGTLFFAPGEVDGLVAALRQVADLPSQSVPFERTRTWDLVAAEYEQIFSEIPQPTRRYL